MVEEEVVVTTRLGTLRGIQEEGTHAFHGVPYALPPVGELRFQAPRPSQPWDGVRDASRPGGASYQVNLNNVQRVLQLAEEMAPDLPGIMAWPGYVTKTYHHENISEDCLYLDIWVPENADSKSLPVYIYYHGGANAVSSGHFHLERGANLAREENIIVVRPTYRMGALGWVHFGLISDELPEAVNIAVQDQIAALKWVYENIAAFGGDPENITVGGESCGATAVSHLLVNTKAQPMIRRAIVHSLSPFNLWCPQPKEHAARIAKRYLELLKVDDPKDLMTISPERLIAVHSVMARTFHPDINMAWRPVGAVDDGNILPGLPNAILSKSKYPRPDFELMIGFAKDEWQFFRGHSHTVSKGSKPEVLNVLSQVFEDNAEQVFNEYQALYPDHAEPGHILSDIMSFEFFKGPSLEIASNFAQQGIPVYVFQFSYDLQGFGGYLRAVHTGDMPFIFRNLNESDLEMWPSFDGEDRNELRHVAASFGSLYGRFIREGNPGDAWPAYNENTETVLWFGKTVEAKEGLLSAEAKIFSKHGFSQVDALEKRLSSNLDQAFDKAL